VRSERYIGSSRFVNRVHREPARHCGTEPAASAPYTAGVAGVIFLIVLAVGVGALIWWGSSLPRTRPRPDSRYRGRTYLEVDRKVKRTKPRD
jgi:hypothetical protein